MELIKSSPLEQRHWDLMEHAMSINFDSKFEDLTYGTVLQAPLLEFEEEIEGICAAATEDRAARITRSQRISERLSMQSS